MRSRLIAVALIGCALVAAYLAGLHQRLEPEALRELLASSGVWGPLVFVALFASLESFGVPGFVFILTAVAVWPPQLAFPLIWAGAVGAGLVGACFARYLARDWVRARMPERFHRYDEQLARRGLAAVIVFRLVFFLAPPAHWALGLSRVPLKTITLGTLIGFLPTTALLGLLGSGLFEWLAGLSLAHLGVALLLIALGLLAWRVLASRRPDTGGSPG